MGRPHEAGGWWSAFSASLARSGVMSTVTAA